MNDSNNKSMSLSLAGIPVMLIGAVTTLYNSFFGILITILGALIYTAFRKGWVSKTNSKNNMKSAAIITLGLLCGLGAAYFLVRN